MAFTSLSLPDFCKRNWKWEKPVFISPPNEIHKNWVLFPEKINGRYAILHSISPTVLVDYVDDLKEFDGTKFINSYYYARSGRKEEWDNWVRGAGPTPIKTKHGWLVLYSHIQNYFAPPAVFGIEAFLLDLKDPSKIIARTDGPLLFSHAEYYEKYGAVPNIIFPSGAFSRDGKLHLYYGAADTVCALATGKMDELVKELMLKRLQMSGLERYRKNPIIIPNSAHAWESKATLNTAAIYLIK